MRAKYFGPILLGLLPATAHAALPMSYLHGNGIKADPVVTLTWALLILSIVVSMVVGLLVLFGAWRRRSGTAVAAIEAVPVSRGGNGLPWLTFGLDRQRSGRNSQLYLVGSKAWLRPQYFEVGVVRSVAGCRHGCRYARHHTAVLSVELRFCQSGRSWAGHPFL